MNWIKAIGFGLAIWGILFLAASLLVAVDAYANPYAKIVLAIAAGMLAIVFADYAGDPRGWIALAYGAIWAGITLFLDYFVTAYFAPEIFSSWALWTAYALILFAPIVYDGGEGSVRVAHAKR